MGSGCRLEHLPAQRPVSLRAARYPGDLVVHGLSSRLSPDDRHGREDQFHENGKNPSPRLSHGLGFRQCRGAASVCRAARYGWLTMTSLAKASRRAALAALFLASALVAADAQLPRLEREIERVSKIAGGVVGASAVHLESGRKVSFHGDERFPMASTFKIPIAVQLLHRIDAGEVKLDQMVELHASDLHPGSGTLTDLFPKPGVVLSVRNLMELMLLISDNSATDILLRLAGGADAVTARMRGLGISGIN